MSEKRTTFALNSYTAELSVSMLRGEVAAGGAAVPVLTRDSRKAKSKVRPTGLLCHTRNA